MSYEVFSKVSRNKLSVYGTSQNACINFCRGEYEKIIFCVHICLRFYVDCETCLSKLFGKLFILTTNLLFQLIQKIFSFVMIFRRTL